MNIDFILNDYALVWSLLFQASISEDMHKFKQHIWLNYKDEYNKVYKDKELLFQMMIAFITLLWKAKNMHTSINKQRNIVLK